MKKPSLWLVIAFIGIGYLAGGKDDKSSLSKRSGQQTPRHRSRNHRRSLVLAYTHRSAPI